MEIKKCTSTHYTRTRNAKIKYLVMHYTGSTHSEPGTAVDTAKYFANATRPASADFICDDKYAVQYNPDIKGRCCYAVGGTGNPKKYKMSTSVGGRLYGKVTNDNSISIEMRSSKVNRKSVKDSDKDWYITDETINTSAKLAAYLLEKYDIPFSNMVMHHEVSYYGKLCPLPFSQKESDLKKWESFKKLVKKYMSKKENNKDDEIKTVTKVDKDENPQVKSYVKGLQKSLNSLGEELDTDGAYGAKTSAAMSRHNVKKGMKNILVKHFQWWLKKAGIYKGEVDSSFGNQTLEAVKVAQKKVGATSDGIIGNGTAKAFMKLLK